MLLLMFTKDGGAIYRAEFQRAPTLGGECYALADALATTTNYLVSTGTHPWG